MRDVEASPGGRPARTIAFGTAQKKPEGEKGKVIYLWKIKGCPRRVQRKRKSVVERLASGDAASLGDSTENEGAEGAQTNLGLSREKNLGEKVSERPLILPREVRPSIAK